VTSLRVLCTNPDNSVAVVVPSPRCVKALHDGRDIPGWLTPLRIAWNFLSDPMWRPELSPVARAKLAGRWVMARLMGGLEEREAVSLIGEVTAPPYATALEVVDASEIPADRTHRNAWRRSRNGGPIWIDETHAQSIDEARMWAAHERKTA
jgi:hypothetical protein